MAELKAIHIANLAADLTITVGEKYSPNHDGNIEISIPSVGKVVIDLSQARSLAYQLTTVRHEIIARKKAEAQS